MLYSFHNRVWFDFAYGLGLLVSGSIDEVLLLVFCFLYFALPPPLLRRCDPLHFPRYRGTEIPARGDNADSLANMIFHADSLAGMFPCG